MPEPRPGDFGLTPTYGCWYDRFFGWLIRWGTDSPVNHAFVYLGDGRIVEAQPGGAAYGTVDEYVRNGITWSSIELTDQQRADICRRAGLFVEQKIGYNWLDLVAIALAQRRAGRLVRTDRAKQPWWVQRMARTDRLICSQLVDFDYYLAGDELFSDHRLFGLVSPGDPGAGRGRS